MLCCLLDGPLSVGEINERVPLGQSAFTAFGGAARCGIGKNHPPIADDFLRAHKRTRPSDHGSPLCGVLRASGRQEIRADSKERA
jgi:hypothetical protein